MAEANSTVTYRDVPGFPGYRVGDDGSVWSRYRQAGIKWELGEEWRRMKPWSGKRSGHLRVRLLGKCFFVHALVLQAFVGGCPDGMECLHRDGNPTNNNVSNLRWGTSAENAADRDRHGNTARGERNGRSKVTENMVRSIRADYAAGGIGLRRLARRHGIPERTLRAIVDRMNWKHVT